MKQKQLEEGEECTFDVSDKEGGVLSVQRNFSGFRWAIEGEEEAGN